jgi:hypothetical protein
MAQATLVIYYGAFSCIKEKENQEKKKEMPKIRSTFPNSEGTMPPCLLSFCIIKIYHSTLESFSLPH